MERNELELLTTGEAAALLKISRRKVYNLQLPRVKIGRLIRWRLRDIERLVEANTHYPPGPSVPRRRMGNDQPLDPPLSLWERAQRLRVSEPSKKK